MPKLVFRIKDGKAVGVAQGILGPGCVEVLKMFAGRLGCEEESGHTSEYYEPKAGSGLKGVESGLSDLQGQ